MGGVPPFIKKAEGAYIYDVDGNDVERPVKETSLASDAAERGDYRHFMQKEIHEQARAVADTISQRIANGKVLDAAFGPKANEIFDQPG